MENLKKQASKNLKIKKNEDKTPLEILKQKEIKKLQNQKYRQAKKNKSIELKQANTPKTQDARKLEYQEARKRREQTKKLDDENHRQEANARYYQKHKKAKYNYINLKKQASKNLKIKKNEDKTPLEILKQKEIKKLQNQKYREAKINKSIELKQANTPKTQDARKLEYQEARKRREQTQKLEDENHRQEANARYYQKHKKAKYNYMEPDSQSTASTLQQNNIFQAIKQEYDLNMKAWPSTPCEFCDRMMYPIGVRRTVLNLQHIETLHSYSVENYEEDASIFLCHTCYTHLQKKKMSAQSKYNLMIVPEAPTCISELTPMEIRLISQVKLHLKIFKLCKNTGQFGMQGTAIHFAQAVNEISNQLPLTSIDSEVVVVAETLEAVTSRREFQIRPEYVLQSLNWLKLNNPLYKDVVIVNRSKDDLNLENIVVLTQPTPIVKTTNYISKKSFEILQGTISLGQSNPTLFFQHGGKQCTSICAAFIAYAFATNLITFTRNSVDQILIDGDRLYDQVLQNASPAKRAEIEGNQGFLNSADITGNIMLENQDITVNLQEFDDDATNLNGLLTKGRKFKANGQNVITNESPTLEQAIQHFLTMDVESCILTTSQYSMAITKQETSVYYFDSHSRTENGRVCTTERGRACLIKFPLESAANQISSLVHINVQPKVTFTEARTEDLDELQQMINSHVQKFIFCVCPIQARTIMIPRNDVEEESDRQENFACIVMDQHNAESDLQLLVGNEVELEQVVPDNQNTIQDMEIDSTSQSQETPSIVSRQDYKILTQPQLIEDMELAQETQVQPQLASSGVTLNEENKNQTRARKNAKLNSIQIQENKDQQIKDKAAKPVEDPHLEQSEDSAQYSIEPYFLHNIDHNEPEIETYIQNLQRGHASNPMQLHRVTGPPIKSYLESHLEELSFVSLFPHGTHGFNDDRRKIKQSALKYFQARIMSSDTRFHCKEYLCYALDRIEQYKIEQQIGIVCNMKHQGSNDVGPSLIPGASNPHLYLKAIRGGASYWQQFGGDVFAMVNMLGVATFWLTFSTDDLNSPELMNAIWKSKYGEASECPYETLSKTERNQLLNENPVLAARYFCTKVKQIISILEKNGELLFGRKVKHHIGRVEFQARGSGHYHMIIWCENTPDYTTEEGIKFINDNVSVSLQSEIPDLVNKYQIHHHTLTCFKNSNSRICRFNFPRDEATCTKILSKEETHKNHGRSVAYARKADERNVNNYHPKLLQLIRSNMDIQVIGNVNDIVFYIAKYISKAEPESISAQLQDALVTAKSSTSETIRRNLMNVANVVTRNRHIGCPEVAFRILGLPLRFCSNAFQFVPAYKKENRIRMIQKEHLRNKKTVICMNIIERYELRPDTEEMRQMCLFEFAALYEPKKNAAFDDVDEELEEDFEVIESNTKHRSVSIQLLHNKGVMVRRRNPKVVKYPMFNKEKYAEDYHYSLLVMFLPFRNEDELLHGFENASSSFIANRQLLKTEHNSPLIKIGLQEELDRAQLRLINDLELLNVDHIGNNNIEFQEYDEDPEIIQDIQPPPKNILQIIQNRVATFSPEQTQVYNSVRQQIQNEKTSRDQPLRLFVSGEGGTGKSYVIQTLTLFIRSILHGIGDPLQIAAPTACAAIPISGLTLHRSFGIPVEIGHKVPPYRKLSAITLQNYRRRYKYLRWIILDEASMISYETFEYINRRLQDIFESQQPFANLNILIFGDILQLKPCNGNWIYKQPSSMKASTDLWRLFGFVELKVNHRQTGSDPLKQICSRLRVGMITNEDLSHLMTRVLGKENTWNQEVKKDWQDVIRIYPTNKLANNCNEANIEDLKKQGLQIYLVYAVDKYGDGNETGQLAPKEVIPTDINKTSGIPSQIQIGLSVRIMLRCNLSLDDKLVNGSRGAIKAIKWPRLLPDQSYTGQLPESVNILFDDPTAGGKLKDKTTNLVCIEPRQFDFTAKLGGRKIHRTMLPFILVAGITCHKVQGQTVSRAVIHLKGWNIFKGGAYVALSRCTSLQGLAITELDTSELIATEKFSPAENSSIDEYKRLRELNKTT